MKTLILIRHATAAPASRDIDRPLSDEGRREAADIARQIAPLLGTDTVILSSTARRTAETAAALLQQLDGQPTYREVSELYLAEANALFDVIRQQDTGDTLVIVAHNPGLGQLAFDLGGAASPVIARGFAPATCALFHYSGDSWLDARPQDMRLDATFSPRDL